MEGGLKMEFICDIAGACTRARRREKGLKSIASAGLDSTGLDSIGLDSTGLDSINFNSIGFIAPSSFNTATSSVP